MATPSQFNFGLEEVTSLLLREANITEGFWTIGLNFNIAVGGMGPDKDRVLPSVMASVDQLVLTKSTELGPLTFDAAKLRAKGN